MTQYPVAPSHSVVVGGLPLYLGDLEQGAEVGDALILPGDLVEYTNPPNDCTIKAAQADSTTVVGVADVHTGNISGGGGDITSAYAAGNPVVVVRGPLTIMLRIAASEEIQCGEFVQPAASGEVKAYICGTDNDCQRIAQALETTTQDTTSFQWGVFALERLG